MEPLEAGASQAAKDADVCERLAQRLRRTWPPAHWGPRPEDTTLLWVGKAWLALPRWGAKTPGVCRPPGGAMGDVL